MSTFEADSAITHLKPFTDNAFLAVYGVQRSVRLWDVRQPHQQVKMFEQCHYSSIQAVERLNDEIFATAAGDGIINIWNTKMNKLLTSLQVHDQGVRSLKFLQKRGMLLCGHLCGFSYFQVTDNFQAKKTIEVPKEQCQITCLEHVQGKIVCGGVSGNLHVFTFND